MEINNIDHKINLLLCGNYSQEFLNDIKIGLLIKKNLEWTVKESPAKFSFHNDDIAVVRYAENVLKKCQKTKSSKS